jgi:hypothetical protein
VSEPRKVVIALLITGSSATDFNFHREMARIWHGPARGSSMNNRLTSWNAWQTAWTARIQCNTEFGGAVYPFGAGDRELSFRTLDHDGI